MYRPGSAKHHPENSHEKGVWLRWLGDCSHQLVVVQESCLSVEKLFKAGRPECQEGISYAREGQPRQIKGHEERT